MIVTFFLVFSYILDLLKAKLNTKDSISVNEEDNYRNVVESDNRNISVFNSLTFGGLAFYENENLRFNPPVCIQRYDAVANVVDLYKLRGCIKKVVDFGCGELSCFGYFKHTEEVEEYIGVDIDRELLQSSFTTVTPLVSDYISRKCSPFKVSIFNGSVVDPDIRLKDTNVTIAVELIEHMYPDELNKLPYNILGTIQPEIAIFTTPNSDFNILFPNFSGFRHLDHKFEWSRSQFEDWANNLILRYPDYKVSFHGIGQGPEGTEHLGYCTQMAIFLRKTQEINDKSHEFREIYECIYEVEYPYITREEKLNNALEYEVYHAIKHFSESEEYHVGNKIEVPLEVFMKKIEVECSFEKLFTFLEKENCDVKYLNNKRSVIIQHEPESSEADLSDYDVEAINYPEKNTDSERATKESWDLDENGDEWKHITNENVSEWQIDQIKTDEKGLNLPENSFSSAVSSNDSGNNTVFESNEDPIHDLSGLSALNGLISESLTFEIVEAENMSDITKSAQSKDQGRAKCSTGTIPKRKNNFSEEPSTSTSSTVPSSPNSSIHLKRDLSLVNIFEDQSQYSSLTAEADVPHLNNSTSGPTCIEGQLVDEVQNSIFENSSSQVSTNNSNLSQSMKKSNSQNNKDVILENIPESDRRAYSSLPLEFGCDQASSIVQRCHSLENINVNNCKNKNFRYSLNVDNDHIDCDTSVVEMELEVCHKVSSIPSLTDTFGSHSKAPDSGYPNSVHDMELDLTPEQVDEIITESESSLEDEESSAEERVEQEQLQGNNAPVVFLDEVENGDVANNNRDGEGNNMEGGEVVIEEAMGFEELAMEGGDVEAGQHESDDEGLYLSALDVSNETIVPEETSSQDPDAFNLVFDLPSSSSLLRLSEIDREPPSPPPLPVEPPLLFPSWFLDILVNDVYAASGDAGADRGETDGSTSTLSSESFIVDAGNDLVEITVQGDTMGGGEPPPN